MRSRSTAGLVAVSVGAASLKALLTVMGGHETFRARGF